MDIRDLKAASDHAQAGIYTISNLINFKVYIGSAVNIKERFKIHKKKLKYKKHPNKHLQAAYDKLGEACFSFDSLEYCVKEQLLIREQFWINLTDCTNPNIGYNKRKIPNSNLGLKWSTETNTKRSLANIGKHSAKRRPWSEEERLAISQRNKGKKHSPEHIEKRIASKRKPEKWPHGYICKCEPCMKLKSQAVRAKQIANAAKENNSGYA